MIAFRCLEIEFSCLFWDSSSSSSFFLEEFFFLHLILFLFLFLFLRLKLVLLLDGGLNFYNLLESWSFEDRFSFFLLDLFLDLFIDSWFFLANCGCIFRILLRKFLHFGYFSILDVSFFCLDKVIREFLIPSCSEKKLSSFFFYTITIKNKSILHSSTVFFIWIFYTACIFPPPLFFFSFW